MHMAHFNKGETIFSAGESLTCIYLITNGSIKATYKSFTTTFHLDFNKGTFIGLIDIESKKHRFHLY